MFEKKKLDNGLRIIFTPLKSMRAITLLVLVGTGSKYETKNINGISHLLEHMMFKGTTSRPRTLDIVKKLDRVGGIYNAFTGKEFMGFWVKVDAKHFNLCCDIVSDMLFNSLFEEAEIAKEKNVVVEEINMTKDNPQGYVLDIWEELLYGDQPAGWSIAGEKDVLQSIPRSEIVKYFKTFFNAENVVISVAGNLEAQEAFSRIEKSFGKFKKTELAKKLPVVEKQAVPQVMLEFKETDQAHLCLGVRAFDMFHKERYPLALIAGVLGGVMSSRLFIKVRERRGLSYYIRTMVENYTDSGYLVTHTGVDKTKVMEVIKVILKEYENLKTTKVSQAELAKIKDNMKGHLYLGLETSDAWASYTGTQEILKRTIVTPEEEIAFIDTITQEDVLRVAQEIFKPEKLNLAMIGPFKDKAPFEKALKSFK